MRILVTFAVEAEFAPWRKLRKFNRIDYEDLRLYRTKIADSEITVLLTGVGNQSAARAMDLMMRITSTCAFRADLQERFIRRWYQETLSLREWFVPSFNTQTCNPTL
jgi:hypothetical protein